MKFILATLSVLMAFLFGYYYIEHAPKPLKEQIEYGGVLWPKEITYKVDKVGDITITLLDELEVYNGKWPAGTKFKFDGDNIEKIYPSDKFEFAQMEFKNPTEIGVSSFPPHTLHDLKVSGNIKIDGLDLKPGCNIQFKNLVLYSAYCEEFGVVYFKRNMELPENSEESLNP